MTTSSGSELDRALQRLAVAERTEDAAWSLVLRARASYEGARAAGDRQAAIDSYFAFVRALTALAPNLSQMVQAAGLLGVQAGLDLTGAE